MNNQNDVDRLLQVALTKESAPNLSADFEKQIRKKLDAGRVARPARRPLLIYCGIGLLTSVLAMFLSGMDWRIAALSVFVPSVATIPLVRPFLAR